MYGFSVYIGSYIEGEYTVNLLYAKAKNAPTKTKTFSMLELLSAYLALENGDSVPMMSAQDAEL